MPKAWVYILECSDGSYYTGCTRNLDRRIAQHQRGATESYTAQRLPVKLLWTREFGSARQAFAAERQLKGWSRHKKQALMQDDFALLHELAQSPEMKERRAKRKGTRG